VGFLLAGISVGVEAQTIYNHPFAGSDEHNLSVGQTYFYYDNGGMSGNYSNNINYSSVKFTCPEGYRIEYKVSEFASEKGADTLYAYRELSCV
jgi:hypothetical protein